MTIYFAGGEFGAFTSNDSNTYEAVTAGRYSSDFARCGLQSVGGSTYALTTTFTGLAEGYLHYRMIHQTSIAGFWIGNVQLGGAGVGGISLEYLSNKLRLQYYNGTGYSMAFTDIGISETALCELDLYWKANTASGEIRIYSGGSLLATSGTIDLSHIPSLSSASFIGGNSGGFNVASEVIVADEPTIGWRLGTLAITGAGTTNTFDSGAATDANEIVHSDATFISSGSAAQIATFATNDLAPGDFLIKGVIVSARAKRGASGPQSMQLAVRAGTTNYFSATKPLDVGYGAALNVWATNPDTGIAWTEADIAAVEIGVKSIA